MEVAGQEPLMFDDVAIYFTLEEWGSLEEWQKDLYKEVMMDNYHTLQSLGIPVVKSELLLLIEGGEEPCVQGHPRWEKLGCEPKPVQGCQSRGHTAELGRYDGVWRDRRPLAYRRRVVRKRSGRRSPNFSRVELECFVSLMDRYLPDELQRAGAISLRQRRAILQEIARSLEPMSGCLRTPRQLLHRWADFNNRDPERLMEIRMQLLYGLRTIKSEPDSEEDEGGLRTIKSEPDSEEDEGGGSWSNDIPSPESVMSSQNHKRKGSERKGTEQPSSNVASPEDSYPWMEPEDHTMVKLESDLLSGPCILESQTCSEEDSPGARSIRRSPNFSAAELEYFVALMDHFLPDNLIRAGAIPIRQRKSILQEIARRLEPLSGCLRTPRQLRHRWTDFNNRDPDRLEEIRSRLRRAARLESCKKLSKAAEWVPGAGNTTRLVPHSGGRRFHADRVERYRLKSGVRHAVL
ncbi:uncharacterized protein [Phyllobates terribilis]|uniref:uncharacterized protein isoform X3 n=1 Tax=Phyllobates terribilis TaxID=111132 RepID=UPI003CCABEC6